MFQPILILVGSLCYFAIYSFRKWGAQYPFLGVPDTIDNHKINRVNYSNETKCRNIFELIFGKSFPKKRPLWLKNPETNRTLELDGYNETIVTSIGIGLAFEYDGEQHYHFVPKWHGTQDGFEKQLRRDDYKNKLCQQQGVVLIRIPYHQKNKEELIYNEIRKKGLYHYMK
jgi:hypothetical protein